ncbi:MAG: HAD-IC family P-type ATPase [Clostridia bacterium]|nr:HAD-IC family P-type ATPase [Clostridia bacterium]
MEAMIGLSQRDVDERIRAGLSNEMPKTKDGGVGIILRRNLLTLFNLLNVLMALALILVGSYRNLLFMGVVISNALIGTVQEWRAKRTHDRLVLLSEGKVTAIRDGQRVQLASSRLVQDDVVILSRGDQVPADAKVLEGTASLDESLLTGESASVGKTTGDTLYSGSFVKSGRMVAQLTAVGAASYAGKLQLSARKVKHGKSRLMGDLQKLIRVVTVILLPVGALLFWKQYGVLRLSLEDSVTKTVASVLGMIPEGLMLLTSVALAAGVVTLGRKDTLVNELYGIETLARTDVICMDKTGTLTGGAMQLEEILPFEGWTEAQIRQRLYGLLSALPSDSPTNAALAEAIGAEDADRALEVIPFSSERKWSAARLATLGTVVMGAPERLCSGQWLDAAQAEAAKGLRVLAVLTGDGWPSPETEIPEDLQPMALVTLSDSLRPQVQETIRYFDGQDVRLLVISGDSPVTVARVAADAGLPDAEKAVDLSAIPGEKDYTALSRDYTVFGRVSPEDKCGLVRALQADGHSVAMIGDGVNDIPALKAADCSIAMAGGSDAASRVAQMTLMGGGFEAMPQILLEGRRVINNITRAAALFLVKNIFSLLLSLAMLALPFAYPFAPIQLTLISTLTVGFPSFVLALQPNKERVRGSFLRNVIARALPGGLCVSLLSVGIMLLSKPLGYGEDVCATLCTLAGAISGFVTLYLTCRPLDGIRTGLLAVVAAGLTGAVLLFPQVFYLVPLDRIQRFVLAGCAVLCVPLQVGLGALIRGFRKEQTGRTAVQG